VYLGGGGSGNRLAKLYIDSADEEAILAALGPLLKRYSEERLPGERFGDFVVRTRVIAPTPRGELFHEQDLETCHKALKETPGGGLNIYW
jgi:sulfite reductase (NADPH) hemoprotein beta-component